MTIENLRNELRKEPRTFQAAWQKCGLTDYAKNRVATDEECAKIRAYYAKPSAQQPKKASVFHPAPVVQNVAPPEPKPEPQEINLPTLATVRRFLLDTILIGLVIGHAGLIWYDCAELWDVPGQIGGGLAFFIVVAALMLATDATKNVTSQIALILVFLIDVAAWFVHRPVFETYRADGTVTDVLCGFLCGMSFGALLIYRHQKNN